MNQHFSKSLLQNFNLVLIFNFLNFVFLVVIWWLELSYILLVASELFFIRRASTRNISFAETKTQTWYILWSVESSIFRFAVTFVFIFSSFFKLNMFYFFKSFRDLYVIFLVFRRHTQNFVNLIYWLSKKYK